MHISADCCTRDIKPANVLLAEADAKGRRIVLADFGIARQAGDISGLTATNMVMGTTAYAAPEQLLGKDIDGRADQYALGCTAFHLTYRSCALRQLQCGGGDLPTPLRATAIDRRAAARPRRPQRRHLESLGERSCDPLCELFGFRDGADRPAGRRVADTVAGAAADSPTRQLSAPAQVAPAKPRRRRLRPAVLLSVVATLVLLTLAGWSA